MIKLKLSVVVPCYNEEQVLEELYRRVTKVCKELFNESYELILVNDGSGDKTWDGMTRIASDDERVVAINLSRNYGHQIALTAGLEFCSGEKVFILDADLQDPPELLPRMLKRMDEGYDVVFGQRIGREGETYFKKAAAFSFYRILDWLSDTRIPADTGDFRLMSRRAVDALNSMPEQHRFIRGMVSWIGLRQVAFLYKRHARSAGETKYTSSRMVKFAIDAITGFSTRPLKLASYLGVGCGLILVPMMLYVFYNYFNGRTVEGWTSLVLVVLAVGSMQLLVLGILGEYISRLYVQSKGRPLFIIQDIAASSHSKVRLGIQQEQLSDE